MLLYLDHAWDKFRAEGRMKSMRDLHDAVIEGAVGRVRPKIMTVCAILFGLAADHVVASHASRRRCDETHRHTDDRRRYTSAILELLIYPVIYVIWRRRELPEQIHEEVPVIPPVNAILRKKT